MRRVLFSTLAFVAAVASLTAQPPGGDRTAKGPPRFALGQLLPPPVIADLKLTPAQQKELDALQGDVKAKLGAILTAEQKKAVENYRPRGAGGPPGGAGGPPGGPGGPGGRDEEAPPPAEPAGPPPARVFSRGALKTDGKLVVAGDATEGFLGDPRHEHNGRGVRFPSATDTNKDGARAASATGTLTNLLAEKGRWYRVRVRGLAHAGFAADDLALKVEYFRDGGTNSLDSVTKPLGAQVKRAKADLADAGANTALGNAAWQDFALDVRTPFPETDTLRVTVGYGAGTGTGPNAELWLAELDVSPIPDPATYAPPAKPAVAPDAAALVKIGGRWHYDPRGGGRDVPAKFDHTNADRLVYLTDRPETPFVGNMSARLRPGYRDREGNTVTKDTFVPESVSVTFTGTHLVMRSKNLPNHPTAVFPDRSRFLDGNPNVIREQSNTWSIPLNPTPNPSRAAAITMAKPAGLPMGPIGVATNGVVFFNPFDATMEVDAVVRLDRCCGHPGPGSEYHYHKYPACVNTPWADDGDGHSPLIGFAFDGYPVFGPYEAKGVLAKDSGTNPLNGYNLHEDAARGPHYHVTPGKFPHIIGGYWGTADAKNRGRRGPPKE